MFKKALIAVVSTAALSAPAIAGSIGTIQGTTSTTITRGTRAVTINGAYTSNEVTVGASTDGTGATANARWSPSGGPVLTVAGIGGASANTGSATFNTNSVTAATYLNDAQHSYTGTEGTTTNGVFFNY